MNDWRGKDKPDAPAPTSGNAYQVKEAEYLYEKLSTAETLLTYSLGGLGGDPDRAKKNPQYRKLQKQRDDIRRQLHSLGNPETRVRQSVQRSAKPQPPIAKRTSKQIARTKKAKATIPDSTDSDIVKRRFIVKKNPTLNASRLCKLFDEEHIPLPEKMKEAGSWEKAYMTDIHRHAIDALISRDRKENKKRRN
jgi:hypothetical protein